MRLSPRVRFAAETLRAKARHWQAVASLATVSRLLSRSVDGPLSKRTALTCLLLIAKYHLDGTLRNVALISEWSGPYVNAVTGGVRITF